MPLFPVMSMTLSVAEFVCGGFINLSECTMNDRFDQVIEQNMDKTIFGPFPFGSCLLSFSLSFSPNSIAEFIMNDYQTMSPYQGLGIVSASFPVFSDHSGSENTTPLSSSPRTPSPVRRQYQAILDDDLMCGGASMIVPIRLDW